MSCDAWYQAGRELRSKHAQDIFPKKCINCLRLPPPPGIIRLSEGFHDRYPVEDYLDLFDQAAYQIQGNLTANASGNPSQPNIIIGKRNVKRL